jgi:hypothetical protein
MVCGSNLVMERNKVDSNPPTNRFPVQADSAEFGRFGTLVTIGRYNPKGTIRVSNEGKNKVAGCYLPHELVKRVSRTIGFALRRPEIAACDFLLIRLVLVYPPVAHGDVTLSGETWLLPEQIMLLDSLRAVIDDVGLLRTEPDALVHCLQAHSAISRQHQFSILQKPYRGWTPKAYKECEIPIPAQSGRKSLGVEVARMEVLVLD